jgi:hypothetical protein
MALVTSSSFAASADKKVITSYVYCDLVLAADDSTEKLDAKDKTLKPALTDALDKSIRSWKFKPGSFEGVPQRTESALCLNIEATLREDNKYDLAIVDASTGAIGMSSITLPKYPAESLRLDHEAVLCMQIDYDVDGNVVKVDRAGDRLSEKQERALKPFVLASVAAAQKWRINPEKVGGKGIAGSVIIPVQFCTQDGNCSAFLRGSKEKEKLALQLKSSVLLGSSQVSIQRPGAGG